ncbi:MAG: proline dehydrogenase family protein, partial [Marinirhabdus sp.]
ATVFDHFCGGVTERDCIPTTENLYGAGVHSVLDYSVEGKEKEAVFNQTRDKIIELIHFAAEKKGMPFSVFKPTGLGRFEIWEKVSASKILTDSEQKEWDAIAGRYEQICQAATDHGVSLLIDAEESWMQKAADGLCETMMKKYNTKNRAVVFNTLQCYRKDRLAYLKKMHERAKKEGYRLGFKIVRGAYLEKENNRARERGYPTPICKSKAATDQMFDTVMGHCLGNLQDICVFLGTHNEASTYLALQTMQAKNIARNDPRIWFGQLYGMSDHISFNLATAGYNVAKYIPFGPVKDVMPYLIRRAEENTSVAGQTSRELGLLKIEKKRRGI